MRSWFELAHVPPSLDDAFTSRAHWSTVKERYPLLADVMGLTSSNTLMKRAPTPGAVATDYCQHAVGRGADVWAKAGRAGGERTRVGSVGAGGGRGMRWDAGADGAVQGGARCGAFAF